MMSVPLLMLLWSSILMFVLIMIPAGLAIHQNGGPAQAGARDNLAEPTVFMKRANRLNVNMRENMIMFTALIVIATALNIDSSNISLGATIFFYARLAHAIIYLAGWPFIRPIVWLVSVIGLGMIAYDLMMIPVAP